MTSIARHHAEWLSLVEVSGPFLSMPVLMRTFPQGLDARDPEKAKEMRLALDEWEDNRIDTPIHYAWIRYVLTQILEFPDTALVEGQAIPSGIETHMPVYGETLRPDIAVINPQGTSHTGKPRLLISVLPFDQSLEKPLAGRHWKASSATRMMEILHSTDVSLGLITNGEHWMLVHAPRGETTGFASWYANLWTEEPLTFQAFCSLLSARRFFGVAENETIEALLVESAQDQQEVTDQLGLQVRRAVEVLVQSLDRNDYDSGRTLLEGIDEKQLYNAALTVMMRLVFLFCAEERGLLLLGHALYDQHYAVSTLRDQLREMADQHGEEVLEYRFDAWARLLATFRGVYGGVEHIAMRLPPYGGDLFDPNRYPFLEGRKPGSSWRETPADPLTINNRTVLHLLEALQILQVKVPGGGLAEARRLSFRALDIEQIGHVYESLLDHTAVRANDTVLGLVGSKDKEPEIPLAKLEILRIKSVDALVKHLAEETGRAEKTIRRLVTEKQFIDEQHLLVACGNDQKIFERVTPFANLLRNDTSGYPVVIHKGSIYVTAGTDRRSSGTHYTPRSLTEPIIQHTLEPLVYEGPSLGKLKEDWKLKSAREILNLKICDMAMGSGAFLVQACRYLSERLVEAWEEAESSVPESFLITPEGELSTGSATERIIPSDATERLAIARRYIADRCLYGVDKNPMAVEMAKLSLWLITLQKDRPFTFLDHALKCGDSLVGITDLDQLCTFSLAKEPGRQRLILQFLEDEVNRAIEKRNQLERLPSIDYHQLMEKNRLYIEAEEATAKLRCAADMLISAEMSEGTAADKEAAKLDAQLKVVRFYNHETIDQFQKLVQERLNGQRVFHWPLEFPEIFNSGGFDALMGNPPFQGGKKITGSLGVPYREYLVQHLAKGKRGNADLCAYFFLRACSLVRPGAQVGLLATNTIAQGETREVGLEQLVVQDCTTRRAISTHKWPGTAVLEVAIIWITRGIWNGCSEIDGRLVPGITPYLTEPITKKGSPYRLAVNSQISFIGSIVLGTGFLLNSEEARALIDADSRNSKVLFPYLTGQDFNSRPDQSTSRWAINFFDWPLNHDTSTPGYHGPVAADYPDCLKIIEARVKPERDRLGGKKDPSAQGYAKYWWQYGRRALELYTTISGMDRVLFHSFTSKYLCFGFAPTNVVFAGPHVVIALADYAYFASLQCSFHEAWVVTYCSTMRTDIRYAPSDLFQTYPLPKTVDGLEEIGAQYHNYRRKIMLSRCEGVTKIYNHFHDRSDNTEDIQELRDLHIKMDYAVAYAYAWNNLDLEHGFHETKHGIRFTISEAARREVLARLLELNHKRYAQEVAQGLHNKNSKQTKSKKPNNNLNMFD